MLYHEYIRAANRHLRTCKLLLDAIENASSNDSSMIMQNIYYLSGYVLETSLSYSFFCHKRWKKNIHIENSEWYECGFKTHDLTAKLSFLARHGITFPGCKIIDRRVDNRILNKMARSWSVDIRYRYAYSLDPDLKFDIKTLKKYIDLISEIKDHIYKLYPI